MEYSLHTVANAAGILAVHCQGCGRRSALAKDRLPIYLGNMTPVSSLDLRCQGCGGVRDSLALYIPLNQDEVVAFLRGEDVERRRLRLASQRAPRLPSSTAVFRSPSR